MYYTKSQSMRKPSFFFFQLWDVFGTAWFKGTEITYFDVSNWALSNGPDRELFLFAPWGGAVESLAPHNQAGLHDILLLTSGNKRPSVSLLRQVAIFNYMYIIHIIYQL